MGFYKKGFRADQRVVKKNIQLSFAEKLPRIPVLTYVAHELSKKVDTLTVGNFLEHVETLQLKEEKFDDLDMKLIIGEFNRLKEDEQRNNNKEH